ncbi:MAG: toxin-antitoxin system YwqK family antitoxin [bacterium]
MKKYLLTFAFLLLSITLFGQTIKDTLYYEKGEVKEIRSFDKKTGKLHGQCIVYSTNGDTLAIAHYYKGEKHGIWKVWRKEDNSLAYEFYYNNGTRVGTWKCYNEQGQLIGEREYAKKNYYSF